MVIVADTNTFLAVTLNGPEKYPIVALTAGRELLAPEILPFELGNALTAMLKKRTLAATEVIAAWRAVNQIPVELKKIDIEAALNLAAEHTIYAYDAYFLECAQSNKAPLLTLDRGLAQVARTVGIETLWESQS
ncbi:MAG: PIN domain-containing protein [Candidatus Latescibacteria bacterium]|nr:PIN domain-containing protein [Candidatus Latescibacterota bacterium]